MFKTNPSHLDEVLLYGGRVRTMAAPQAQSEALLLRGGRIAAVGPRRDLEQLASTSAQRVDIEGGCVLPGLLDTHPHLLHYGSLQEPLVQLGECRNHGQIVERLRRRAVETAAGEWIQATPVGEAHYFHRRSFRDLEEGILPDRYVLDRASQAHPIVIQAWGPVLPSCMAFNSRALQEIGVTRFTPDRIGNVWIEKDANGEPTGLLSGSVINYYNYDEFGESLWRKIPFLKYEHLVPGALTAIGQYHAQGVTGVYENHMMDKVLIDAWRQLRSSGRLRMRVLASQEAESYGMPWSKPRSDEEFQHRLEEAAREIVLDDDLMRFNGITIMWDGYCFAGTQMMRAPYYDAYGKLTRGRRHITPEKAEAVMRFCAERGLRLNTLAMGTRAHEENLELLERIAREHDIRSLNWVLVHATTIEAEQVRRYKALNFDMTTSMTFCWGEGELHRRRMGAHILEDLMPLRRFFDAGMAVGGASDWGPKNAWEQIQLSLTHEFGESGFRNLGPAQRITRHEAVSMMTSGAARVMQWPDIGSIQPGHHADLVIVDRDPFECPIDEIGATRVLRTVFAGEAVFDAGVLQ